eukprot:scaffold5.g958.t1
MPITISAPPRRRAAKRDAGRAFAGAAAADGGASGAAHHTPAKPSHLAAWLMPLHDRDANKKLLALSSAQMLSSIATLMHDTYIPLYMAEVLHMSNASMGNLHALLQFLSRASGIISGRLADVFTPAHMVLAGTLLTALVKPMFGLTGVVYGALGTAACVSWISFAKALVSDLAASTGDSPSAAFSLRQSLSTLGMLVGATAASLAFKLMGRSYVATFALSTPVALVSFALVAAAFGLGAGPEHHAAAQSMDQVAELSLAGKLRAVLGALGPGYWQPPCAAPPAGRAAEVRPAPACACSLAVDRWIAGLTLATSAQVMDAASLPMLTPLSMVPVVVLAAPLGMHAKKSVKARNSMLFWGMSILILADLFFAFVPSLLGMMAGSLCVGLHMAMTQGVGFGMLATYIPSAPVPGLGRISGTTWSVTDLLLGVALAISNTVAGRLCDVTVARGLGPTGCFMGGVVGAAAAMAALAVFSTVGALGLDPAKAA